MLQKKLTHISIDELKETFSSLLRQHSVSLGRALLIKYRNKMETLETKIKKGTILDKEIKKFLKHQVDDLYAKIEKCQTIIDEEFFSKTHANVFEDVDIALKGISHEYDKANLLFYFKKNLAYLKVLEKRNDKNLKKTLLEICEYIEKGIDVLDKILPEAQLSKTAILYIYKGNITCHKNNHKIIQATAVLHNQSDDEIELNVEYCTECEKYLLEYSLFEQYRNRYGVLIGNLRMVTNGNFDGEYDLALESPLRLSGYNVGQKDNFTSNERHYILARIIHDEIMSKGDVIRYLSYFIRMNGAKYGNELAVAKWEEDLAFVQEYNINIQPRAIIRKVEKYSKR